MPQAIEQAVRFHQEGRLGDAERFYREALRASPRSFEALHLLGALKLQQGQAEEAVQLIAAALNVERSSAAAYSNYGLALGTLGRHAEALASYDQALAIDPKNAQALASRGDTLCDLGRPAEALASYDKAIAIDARLLSALVNRGVLVREMGRPAEALASYDKALTIDPNDAEAWNNRGVALHDLGRYSEALASYDRALAQRSDHLEARYNHGNALLALKRPADALVSYARVLAQKPELADAHNSRGHALYDLMHFEEALASYDKALALKEDLFDARIARARSLVKLDRHAQALAEYEKLRALKPDTANLLTDLAHCRATVCDWSEGQGLAAELRSRAIAGASLVDPFMFLGIESSAQEQLACAQNWVRQKKFFGVARAWERTDFAGDRIRIAYLSADFHRHATAYLIAELFEIHDRRRFEIFGISFGPDDHSDVRARLMKSFDRFFDVTTRTNEDAAKLIRDLKPHIAVDLKGHTADARPGILAQRTAPIQAAYLGYPGTLGADFIDYVIADPVVLPFEQQRFYTEKIVHLPESYQVNDSTRPIAACTPTRGEVGLPERSFVFCCFNNTWKINEPLFEIWMRLLQAVEGSVLWLYQPNRLVAVNLCKEALVRGVDPARLVFAQPRDLADHLARHKLADLFLDTLPYNAHTTASDALWAGLPVVTCLGPNFSGRVAASLLRATGLPELVTATLADYEALALRLARDPALLQSLKTHLDDQRQKCPLFDTARFCRHLESAYATMWDIWQRGESPKSFSVDAIGAAGGQWIPSPDRSESRPTG